MTELQTHAKEAESPAWDEQELSGLHDNDAKAVKVQAMFNAIARSYDLNNRVHSLWRDEAWRKHAVKKSKVRKGDRVLDVACGTGDLTQAFAKQSQAGEIIGVDYTEGMLDIARHKREKLVAGLSGRVSYAHGDAMNLDYEDESFDVLSIAFGIRNVQVPSKAMGEFFRVLKPGGRLVVLEFDTPKNPFIRWFNNFYCGSVMPRTATWIARDTSGAYKYLPKSVSSFMTREQMLGCIKDAGFVNGNVRGLTLGICACYDALKST
ncbi:MAG: bifunctional demethylmenaquinone methyltransferase/2-methoxy-6-polyprenyl-1,4-benzoquinol methylase UbiE [Phycisphaerales bacterium]